MYAFNSINQTSNYPDYSRGNTKFVAAKNRSHGHRKNEQIKYKHG